MGQHPNKALAGAEDPAATTMPGVSVLALATARDNTDEGTGEAVRNGTPKQMELSAETTGAKGKVAEESNFLATAGSSTDLLILNKGDFPNVAPHPQGDGAEDPTAMTMPKESVLALASTRDNTDEGTGKAVRGPATGHHCWE